MPWTELSFGKHEGKTLPQVLFADPDWFFWAFEEGVLQKNGFKAEADALHRKATRIRIPPTGPEELVAEYLVHVGGKFGALDIVPRSRPLHEGSSPAFRSDFIDLSVPRRIAKYDKRGCKMLVDSVKFHLFGNAKTKMTRQRCEAFFDDASNFVP